MRQDNQPAQAGQQQAGARRPSAPAARPQQKRGAKQKFANGLIALSSAAVMAVYAAGYANTAPAAASIASVISSTATAPPAATATTPATPTSSIAAPVTTTATTAAPATATTAATTTQAASASSAYRDGTYTGSGTSRHGGVTVAVTIKNGAISAVAITASNTRYPISRIAALPGEVLTAQSADIDFVSGATDSSMAFQTAVASALARAQE